ANPLARRPCEERDRAALRDEAAIRVLGVQPHLDGVPLWLRPPGELSAGGDLDLRPYEVESEPRLGHRMLHLEPGVHLEKVERTVRAEQELHRPGSRVLRIPGERDR